MRGKGGGQGRPEPGGHRAAIACGTCVLRVRPAFARGVGRRGRPEAAPLTLFAKEEVLDRAHGTLARDFVARAQLGESAVQHLLREAA